MSTILVDQFTRLRDGDRLWYQRVFQGPFLSMLEKTTLAGVIQRNTGMSMQPNVFYMSDAQPSGTLDPTVLPAANASTSGQLDRGLSATPRRTVPVVPLARLANAESRRVVAPKAAWSVTENTDFRRDLSEAREKHSDSERIREKVFADFEQLR